MASTQDRLGTEQEPKGSLLPDPVPAHKLGLTDDGPQRSLIRPSRTRPTRPPFIILIVCLLLPLALMVWLVLSVFHPTETTATIMVTAQQHSEEQSVAIVAAIGSPTDGIQARFISATSTQRTATPVPATGSKSIPQLVAKGTMTFYNLASYVQTVPTHTVLTATNGVQVETLTQAVVPPASGTPLVMGQTTVPAQATQAGAVGNLSAHEVATTCCQADGTITARNEQSFSGGQDATTYAFIQQSDIDQASASLLPQAIQAAKHSLSTRVANSERAVDGSQSCTTFTVATPPVTSKAATVNVSVVASCREEVYQQNAAVRLASNTYREEVQKHLGSSYVLNGQPITGIVQATIQDQMRGTVLVTVPVHGIWSYQLDKKALQHLAPQLTGKSWSEAQALLLKQPGIQHVALIGLSGDTLPTDANHIAIDIQQ